MNDEYLIYGETLTAIADSIRSVSSVSTTWTPDEMAAYILTNLVKPTKRQAAKTYTPSTSNQTIPAGTFLTGAATIQGDADWTEGNIKKGVNMWGKTGTLDGIFGTPGTFYGFTKAKSGSFTMAAIQSADYTVTHNLGTIPKFVALYTEDSSANSSVGSYALTGVLAFQTTALSKIDSGWPTDNGVYMLAAFYGGYNSTMKALAGDMATPNLNSGSIVYTMRYATYNNANRSSPIQALSTTSFVIPYFSSVRLAECTYKWLVMA